MLPMALVAALGCAGASASPRTAPAIPKAAPPAAAVLSASFTVQQVERGRDEFRSICGECHSTSDFRGRTFLFEWRRRTAWDFFRNVTQTMPEDAPGSLTDQQYVDIIAYVLRLNGYAAGAVELGATEAALDQFVMDGAPSPDGTPIDPLRRK